MNNVTYERASSRLVKVKIDGAFAGWLEQQARRTTGLHSERYTYWAGIVAGKDYTATTLTGLKAKIAA